MLEQSLKSIDDQEGSIDRYIVVNTPDWSIRNIVMNYLLNGKKQYCIIELAITTEKIGLAYNFGVWYAMQSRVRYDVIAKIDDDIVMRHPSDLECMAAVAMHDGIVAFPPTPEDGSRHESFIRSASIPDISGGRTINYVSLYGACNLYSRKMMNRLGYFDETASRGMDTEWGVRAQMCGFQVTHAVRSCIHLGHNAPTEGKDKETRKSADISKISPKHNNSIVSNKSARNCLISNVIGYRGRHEEN